MDIESLRAIAAVHTYGSYFEAAYQLSIEYSVLTKKISKAEKELGVTIFQRALRGKPLVLTKSGKKVIKDIQSVVNAYDHLLASVDECVSVNYDQLRVGFWRTNGSFDENELISSFFVKNPTYELKRFVAPQEELCNALSVGKLDCVFINDLNSSVISEINKEFFDVVPLAGLKNIYVVVGPDHPLHNMEILHRNEFSLLSNEKFVFDSRQSRKSPSVILDFLGINETAEKIMVDYSDQSIAYSLVKQNQAVMPSINGKKLEKDGFHAIKLDGWNKKMLLYIVYPKNNKSKLLREFLAYTLDFYQERSEYWNHL